MDDAINHGSNSTVPRSVFAGTQLIPNSAVRLFCFPHAGASASFFRKWHGGLPSDVELWPVQLPGREDRIRETRLTSVPAVVAEVSRTLKTANGKPFAFFGHSMGALVCFELARRLRREGRAGPIQLFVSGRRAPHLPRNIPCTYNLPEPEFLEELRKLKGTPPELLQSQELMEVMMPVLRADFQICQTYEYQEQPPLSCPITAFGGLEDEITREDLEGWQHQTTSSFRLHLFPGGHFFIRTEQPQLLNLLARHLSAHRLGSGSAHSSSHPGATGWNQGVALEALRTA